MDKNEFELLLAKSYAYFDDGEYRKFLDAFGKCYAFDMTCFDSDVNVFRLSLASYASGDDTDLTEFNRFFPLLGTYLKSLPTATEKESIQNKIKEILDDAFVRAIGENSVVYYPSFNKACFALEQQYKYLVWLCENDTEVVGLLKEELYDAILRKIVLLKKVIFCSGSKYVSNFVFLPKRPRKFLREIKKGLKQLKKKSLVF